MLRHIESLTPFGPRSSLRTVFGSRFWHIQAERRGALGSEGTQGHLTFCELRVPREAFSAWTAEENFSTASAPVWMNWVQGLELGLDRDRGG